MKDTESNKHEEAMKKLKESPQLPRLSLIRGNLLRGLQELLSVCIGY